MLCKDCKSELPDGHETCPQCGGRPEKASPASAGGEHEMDYVQVFETTDTSLLPVLESVLKGAGIRFVIQGEEGLGVLPVGGYGSTEKMHGLGATVFVPREQEADARELLAQLDSPS